MAKRVTRTSGEKPGRKLRAGDGRPRAIIALSIAHPLAENAPEQPDENDGRNNPRRGHLERKDRSHANREFDTGAEEPPGLRVRTRVRGAMARIRAEVVAHAANGPTARVD